MLRIARSTGFAMVLLMCCAYAADWAIWRVRLAGGSGTGSGEVSQLSAVALKGNKEEYFADETLTVTCSRSAFPLHGGDGWTTPCWWLRRHPQVVERY